MKVQIGSIVPGFLLALLLAAGGIAVLLFIADREHVQTFHDVPLPSGKIVKITSQHFAWGMEHSERFPEQDCFTLEYVSNIPGADQEARDREALEVFELIRPISELWHIKTASVSAFPTLKRKGSYDLYVFTRSADGKWSYKHIPTKVFIND